MSNYVTLYQTAMHLYLFDVVRVIMYISCFCLKKVSQSDSDLCSFDPPPRSVPLENECLNQYITIHFDLIS